MEAKLTWFRLNAELKNWRNVGRESLAFLERRKERERKEPSASGRVEWRRARAACGGGRAPARLKEDGDVVGSGVVK